MNPAIEAVARVVAEKCKQPWWLAEKYGDLDLAEDWRRDCTAAATAAYLESLRQIRERWAGDRGESAVWTIAIDALIAEAKADA